mmetsp:Transcript_13462/g.22744  ORF Transcript_13462/g.22744 Transcript_13462/m.22744 type:complete len:246 (-) Transcript_13462:2056-2793(-)
MGAALLVRVRCVLKVADRLQMLRVFVVRGPQMDAVVRPGHLDGLLPLSTRLEEVVEQVEALTPGEQLPGVLDEAQVHRHRAHPRVHLLVLRRLPQRPRPPYVAHVADAVLRHVQPLRLYAHVRHVLPHSRRLDQLHRLVRLVHIPHGQKEAKVQERFPRFVVHILQSGEVLQQVALHVINLGHRQIRIDLFVAVEVRHVDPADALVPPPGPSGRLKQHPIVRAGEQRGHLHLIAIITLLDQAVVV